MKIRFLKINRRYLYPFSCEDISVSIFPTVCFRSFFTASFWSRIWFYSLILVDIWSILVGSTPCFSASTLSLTWHCQTTLLLGNCPLLNLLQLQIRGRFVHMIWPGIWWVLPQPSSVSSYQVYFSKIEH